MKSRTRRTPLSLPRGGVLEGDELLQPTFETDFDVTRFDPLYRPNSILWVCFFGGPVAGGILYGLNYRCMRMPREAVRVWIAAALLGFALIAAMTWLDEHGREANWIKQIQGLQKVLYMGLSVAFGWTLARLQRPNFAAYVNARRKPRAVFWHGIAAILAGFAAIFVFAFLWVLIFKSPP